MMIFFKKIWQSRAAQWMRVAAGVTCVLLLMLAIGLTVDGLTNHIGHADVAIVPGNRVEADGQPSVWLQSRLDTTLTLYREGWFEHILVSGATGVEGFDEAVVMKQYLVAAGVPEEAVLVDSGGKDTFSTAKNCAELIRENGWKSALVVSQFYHIPRTKLALSRFGVSTLYSAHAEGITWRGVISLARELVAYPVYFVRLMNVSPAR